MAFYRAQDCIGETCEIRSVRMYHLHAVQRADAMRSTATLPPCFAMTNL